MNDLNEQRPAAPQPKPCETVSETVGAPVACTDDVPRRMLLHACCGPCTLEPSRILRDEGFDITVYYANSNIWPPEEYAHRGETLHTWAATDDLDVVDGEYEPADWARAIAAADKAWKSGEGTRAERCRACYRQRLEAAADYAATHGYEVLSTTLAVSPYQHTAIIAEELVRAAEAKGLTPYFEDFRPNYDEATRRSRALGMYRQNYCGCELSIAEAAEDRARIKRERAEARARERAAFELEHAEELAAAAAALEERRAAKRAYEEERARVKAAKREARLARKAAETAARGAEAGIAEAEGEGADGGDISLSQ